MAASAGSTRIGACLLFMSLHAAALLLDPTRLQLLNYPFLIAACVIGVAAVWRLGRESTSLVRIAWMLLGAGLVIWLGGALAAAWGDLVLKDSPFLADLSDFLYLSYGVAVIAALALPDRPALVRRLVLVDMVQSLLAVLLCYVAVFSVLPFSARTLPIPVGRMAHLLLVENLALLAIAALRVLGRSHSRTRAGFNRSILMFLALYAAGATTYNAYAVSTGFSPGMMSLLLDPPFLSLLLIRPTDPEPDTAPVKKRRSLTLLVDGATPAFFTLLLLWLCVSIMETRFALGSVAMVLALGLMVIRSALTESHHLQAQDALALTRDRLLRLSLHDDLTGIANRRAFQAALVDCWNHHKTDQAPLSLLLIDIDHFKAINDRLGHEAGDTCLKMVATALDGALDGALHRGGNLFRYGGEEFAVLLPHGPDNARRVAERLRAEVFRLAIPNRTQTGDRVTISIGVADAAGSRTSPRLISAADKALYKAKAGGRNMVRAEGDPP